MGFRNPVEGPQLVFFVLRRCPTAFLRLAVPPGTAKRHGYCLHVVTSSFCVAVHRVFPLSCGPA